MLILGVESQEGLSVEIRNQLVMITHLARVNLVCSPLSLHDPI